MLTCYRKLLLPFPSKITKMRNLHRVFVNLIAEVTLRLDLEQKYRSAIAELRYASTASKSL